MEGLGILFLVHQGLMEEEKGSALQSQLSIYLLLLSHVLRAALSLALGEFCLWEEIAQCSVTS